MEGEGWIFDGVEKIRGPDSRRIRIGRFKDHGIGLEIDGLLQMVEKDDYTPLFGIPALLSALYPKLPAEGLRVFIAGGGDGALVRLFLSCPYVKSILLAEISKMVVESTQKYTPFWGGCENDPRLQVIYDDALQVAEHSGSKYHLVVLDLTDSEAEDVQNYHSAAHLIYENGLPLFARMVQPQGLLVMQAGELSNRRWAVHLRLREILKKLFPAVYSYAGFVDYIGYPQSFLMAFPQAGRAPFSPANHTDITEAVVKELLGEYALGLYELMQPIFAVNALPIVVQKKLGLR